MKFERKKSRLILGIALAAMVVGLLPLFSGCQMVQNGQTLPSPWYLDNEIQYFPSGNEFQYQQEVDRINREKADRQLTQQPGTLQ